MFVVLSRIERVARSSPLGNVSARQLVALPPLGGYRLTRRRLLNLYLNRLEYLRGRTRLRSYPTRLVVEPANACNLRCPYCLTGTGAVGRPAGLMTMDLYRRLLQELGDYLFEIEAFQWGEPLLSPYIYAMIEAASARGIATTINTNFSVPFDRPRAERLVASGLSELTVSIDGARQESYQRYRVRGDLNRVRENCRLLAEAKRRLGRDSPRFNLEFHVFPHNVDDIDGMRDMARELGMQLRIFKGVVPGADWDTARQFEYCVAPIAVPCIFLWGTAVVSTDGGVLACRGAFRTADDMGRLAVRPNEIGAARFRDVWNGARFQSARRFYRRRDGTAEERRQLCFECPNTQMWERWKAHRAAGGTRETFDVGYSLNGIWNYFWEGGRVAAREGEGENLRRPPPAAGRAG
jgi:pyruvate-formate lyase-activating enzyme